VVELVLLEKMRLVLDTQVWIDWLVFDDPATHALRAALAEGHAQIFIDAPCEAELERVLGYSLGRRTLDATAQAACLSQCRRIATKVEGKPVPEMPRCRDPDDQMFLELAVTVEADYLVTRDQALLELDRRKLAFRIVPPGRF
jgi:putative PIN family toxin of toxin-antitoxin system